VIRASSGSLSQNQREVEGDAVTTHLNVSPVKPAEIVPSPRRDFKKDDESIMKKEIDGHEVINYKQS